MGKTFLTSDSNEDKVGDVYLVMYSKFKTNTPRPNSNITSLSSSLPSLAILSNNSMKFSSPPTTVPPQSSMFSLFMSNNNNNNNDYSTPPTTTPSSTILSQRPLINIGETSTNNNGNNTINGACGCCNDDDDDINFVNGIHYTIVIDVGGETLNNIPIGLEVHITCEKGTNKIQLDFERKYKMNTSFKEDSIYLGKIENLYHKFSPLEWSFGLTRSIVNWFNEFLNSSNNNAPEDNDNSIWSKNKNCLTFSKYLVDKFKISNPLKLDWPI